MDRKELEDCMHALGQVYAFFGKEFDEIQRGFWLNFVRGQEPEIFLSALRQYPNKGRYSPKPKDIAEIIEEIKPREQAIKAVEANIPHTDCPPSISRAWMFWLAHWYGMNPASWPKVEGVSEKEAEAMLMLINREAKNNKTPEAIPAEYKVAEIWG